MGSHCHTKDKVCDICGGNNPRSKFLLVTCSICYTTTEHVYCMRRKVKHKVPEDWVCESCLTDSDSILMESEKTEDVAQNDHLNVQLNTPGLERIKKRYNFLGNLRLRIGGADVQACWPGGAWSAWSGYHCSAGVILPLKQYFIDICDYFGIAPFQLVPNSYRILSTLKVLYHQKKWPTPSPLEIHYMYNLKANPGRDDHSTDGFYYLSAWPQASINLVTDIPSNAGPYKKNFFFTTAIKSQNLSFQRAGPYKRPKADNEIINRVEQICELPSEEKSTKVLLTDVNLRECGLFDSSHSLGLSDSCRLGVPHVSSSKAPLVETSPSIIQTQAANEKVISSPPCIKKAYCGPAPRIILPTELHGSPANIDIDEEALGETLDDLPQCEEANKVPEIISMAHKDDIPCESLKQGLSHKQDCLEEPSIVNLEPESSEGSMDIFACFSNPTVNPKRRKKRKIAAEESMDIFACFSNPTVNPKRGKKRKIVAERTEVCRDTSRQPTATAPEVAIRTTEQLPMGTEVEAQKTAPTESIPARSQAMSDVLERFQAFASPMVNVFEKEVGGNLRKDGLWIDSEDLTDLALKQQSLMSLTTVVAFQQAKLVKTCQNKLGCQEKELIELKGELGETRKERDHVRQELQTLKDNFDHKLKEEVDLVADPLKGEIQFLQEKLAKAEATETSLRSDLKGRDELVEELQRAQRVNLEEFKKENTKLKTQLNEMTMNVFYTCWKHNRGGDYSFLESNLEKCMADFKKRLADEEAATVDSEDDDTRSIHELADETTPTKP
ncbi:uncharacterized protein LOC133829661 isoform X2 [Humulus lupulus]|uniref:uncharacterized protein LOC133829661 isoform X2 n=1 Tax=Humulus lupulus TaxID=3486 RepID=UPI002B40A290|nr:uncharacterized protein LOC133829661 isoform X2 [Humulus lupulus]